MKPRFSQEKRLHYERCRIIPKIAFVHDEYKRAQLMSDREVGSRYASFSIHD